MIKQGIDPYLQASFSFKNRLGRVLWSIVYTLIFRLTPRTAHGLRASILRIFGARIGKGVHVYPSARIWAPWNLVMKDHSCLADNTICYSMATITIGRKVVISQGAHLCTGTHDYEDPMFQLYALPIAIESDAWICAEAFIGPGTTVGEGAVVGARAVATKNVPAWMVCGGNPCRPLKPRQIRRPGN